jgi:uncharacterized membrane protein YfcA
VKNRPDHRRTAFLFAVPIAVLGGLIGLGGAEFRLPVLAGVLRYSARQAVPLNLSISLVTVIASLLIRAGALPMNALSALAVPITALIAGAMISAAAGASLASRLPEHWLEATIRLFLLAIGGLLIVEAFLPLQGSGFIPAEAVWRAGAGVLFGLLIGLVSSMLGVAGGELIIPTLIFAFGADVKVAGTASLIISLPTIMVGLFRYARRGAFTDRAPLRETVAPMGAGSIIGALIGGVLVGIVSAAFLKLLLGIVLIISAVRMFRH